VDFTTASFHRLSFVLLSYRSPPCRWTIQQLPSTGFRLYYYHTDHLLVGGLYNSFLPHAFACITIIHTRRYIGLIYAIENGVETNQTQTHTNLSSDYDNVWKRHPYGGTTPVCNTRNYMKVSVVNTIQGSGCRDSPKPYRRGTYKINLRLD